MPRKPNLLQDDAAAFTAARHLARIGYFRLDAASERLRWSAEVFRIYGMDPTRGQPTLDMALAAFPPKTNRRIREQIRDCLATRRDKALAATLVRPDGLRRTLLVRFTAAPVDMRDGISGCILDATDAESLDERVLRERDLLQATLDHMDQGLMVVDEDLSVPVLSRRLVEMLDLPDGYASGGGRYPDLLEHKKRRGLQDDLPDRVETEDAILRGGALDGTHVCERVIGGSLALEVRTTRLPSGSFVRTYTDISARRRREEEVSRAQAEYRMLFENSVAGIYRTSLDGRQMRANPALVRMNGYETEAELCAAIGDIAREWYVDPERRAVFVRLMLAHGRVDDFVSEVVRHRTGERIWVAETAWLIRDAAGAPIGFEGTVVEATERVTAEARVQAVARRDVLTGLPNRMHFGERLDDALAGRAAAGGSLAVLAIDLDRFKGVNDALGHAAGDILLATIASRLAGIVRDGDTVARLGGDEFAIILPAAGPEDAARLAARVVRAVEVPVEIEGRDVGVGVSIGIAHAPDHGDDPATLMKAADIALYRAKAEGRNCWRLFTEASAARVKTRRQLELDLRNAVARSEFSLIYQPVVRLPDRAPVAYEALLRWSRRRQDPVDPLVFIPAAEETGLIVPLGEWVLREACREAAGWDPSTALAVNVSPVQIAHPSFAGSLARILGEAGLPPARLILEVTETALIDPRLDLRASLRALRAEGLRLALDDFGTGFSAWSMLKGNVFDILKIDGSFIAGHDDPEMAPLLSALLEVARRLGLEAVAEGVETEDQLAYLAAQGCTMVQGHLTGRELHPSAIVTAA